MHPHTHIYTHHMVWYMVILLYKIHPWVGHTCYEMKVLKFTNEGSDAISILSISVPTIASMGALKMRF